MRGLRFAVLGLALVWTGAAGAQSPARPETKLPAQPGPPLRAAECEGNPGALGTSRTLVVDPAAQARIGGMQYQQSLPLEDHEVVLTFDDGPKPPQSTAILDILASECVKASYFLVGRMARKFPEVVRRIREAGHTIGTHSYNHPARFSRLPLDVAEDDVNEGIAAVAQVLGDGWAPAPFFRIPELSRNEGLETYLAGRHIQVWSADFPADDWMKISASQVLERALARLESHHRGILLLHDIHQRTVEALPALLREMKRRGYRIVHVVPATTGSPETIAFAKRWPLQPAVTVEPVTPGAPDAPVAGPAPDLVRPADAPSPAAPETVPFELVPDVSLAEARGLRPKLPRQAAPTGSIVPLRGSITVPTGQ
jgi:peptidoglycan-N-acetylglucosamine deacetylase